MGKLVDVVHCEECIHNIEGECEQIEYDVVKPYEFCWWGQTVKGRTSMEVDAIPLKFLENLRDYAQNEEAALIIDEIIAQWRYE